MIGTFWLLTKRAVREVMRTPESTVPVIFIPLFFLLINRGSLGDQFAGLAIFFALKSRKIGRAHV